MGIVNKQELKAIGIALILLIFIPMFFTFILTIKSGSSILPKYYEGITDKKYDVTTTGNYRIDTVTYVDNTTLMLKEYGSIDFTSDYYVQNYKDLYPLDLKNLKKGDIVKVIFKPFPKGWIVCKIEVLPSKSGYSLGERGYIIVDTIKELSEDRIVFSGDDIRSWTFHSSNYKESYAKLYPLNLEHFKIGDTVKITFMRNNRNIVIKKIEFVE